MAATWKVWSWDARNKLWMQVDQGPKTFAKEMARFSNAAAEKHGLVDAVYTATPPNTHPGSLPSTPAVARRAELDGSVGD